MLRKDNTSPRNEYCADNFRAGHFILQHSRLLSDKSLFAQDLSYGKMRHRTDVYGKIPIGCVVRASVKQVL